jgi:WD40 repeat protein
MTISVVGQVDWMAFGLRGELLAIRDADGVKVYDFVRDRSNPRFSAQNCSVCALSQDERLLACGMYMWSEDFIRRVIGQRVEVWDLERSKVIATIELPHATEVPISTAIEFSSSSEWLAVVRMDGLVSATYLPTRQTIRIEESRDRFFLSHPSCFFFPDTRILAYTYLDETITIIDLDTRQRILTLKVSDTFRLIGHGRADSKIIAARYGNDDYNNQIGLMDTDTGAFTPLVGGGRGYRWSPSSIQLSRGGDYLAAVIFKEAPSLFSAKATFSVGVWNARTGATVCEVVTDNMTEHGLSPSVFSLAFAPAGKLLIGRQNSIEALSIAR